jgi:hypothetical protein
MCHTNFFLGMHFLLDIDIPHEYYTPQGYIWNRKR